MESLPTGRLRGAKDCLEELLVLVKGNDVGSSDKYLWNMGEIAMSEDVHGEIYEKIYLGAIFVSLMRRFTYSQKNKAIIYHYASVL